MFQYQVWSGHLPEDHSDFSNLLTNIDVDPDIQPDKKDKISHDLYEYSKPHTLQRIIFPATSKQLNLWLYWKIQFAHPFLRIFANLSKFEL